MLMEGLGPQKQLTNQDLISIIEHLEIVCIQCADTTKTKTFRAWIIDAATYNIFVYFFGERVKILKPEERINGYKINKDPI